MEPRRTDMVIGAPRHLAWETLADLEGVSRLNPAIDAAACVSDQRRGSRLAADASYIPADGLSSRSQNGSRSWSARSPSKTPYRSEQGRRDSSSLTTKPVPGSKPPSTTRSGSDRSDRSSIVTSSHRHLSSAWTDSMDGLRRHPEAQAPRRPARRQLSPIRFQVGLLNPSGRASPPVPPRRHSGPANPVTRGLRLPRFLSCRR
jgi:hypothetical protein